MELVGECEVASQRVSSIIRCVGKWLFEKHISIKELPSSSTVVNFLDRAHVLGKYHVAEASASADRWGLHTDGISRDQKR